MLDYSAPIEISWIFPQVHKLEGPLWRCNDGRRAKRFHLVPRLRPEVKYPSAEEFGDTKSQSRMSRSENSVRHNGVKTGFLYVVDEDLDPDDLIRHPHPVAVLSAMGIEERSIHP